MVLALGAYGIFLLLCSIYWRITISGSSILYRSFLGVERALSFYDITEVKIKSTSNGYKIVVYENDERTFSINSNCKGYDEFLSRIALSDIKISEGYVKK
jgi:hypothetical protein